MLITIKMKSYIKINAWLVIITNQAFCLVVRYYLDGDKERLVFVTFVAFFNRKSSSGSI